MSKNDSQGKNRGARRRPNGKSFISRFQWDSVDDQAQEDLIVPTSSSAPSSSKRRGGSKPPRRREKEVGTMYVSPSDDFYGAPKKKARPEPRLEDYADFVADVEDGELDAFATPSYGRTRLTRDDEALVEELATKKERAVRQKRAPKPVADDEAQEREAVEREARKAARRDEREK